MNILKVSAIVLGLGSTASVAAAEPAGVLACQAVDAGPLTPWARGACALDHSKNPESWVRGWASFDSSTSRVTVHLNLETDSVTGGPCAVIHSTLRDASGVALATIQSEREICLGGKLPGKAVQYDWTRSASIPANVAKRVVAIDVNVTRTKNIPSIWGIYLKDIADAVGALSKING